MKYKLLKDEQILDKSFRAKVIKEIQGSENLQRKTEAQKRHEIYKDNTKKWVIESLAKEGLKTSTLEMMSNRASNISICKKIVDKLARCYVGGVQRTASDEKEQAKVDDISKILKLNTKNKKADRYRELFRNCIIQVVPVKNIDASEKEGSDKFDIEYRIFAPWQYDVIEDYYDHEKPRVVVLSDFAGTKAIQYATVDGDPGSVGAHVSTSPMGTTRPDGDGSDQIIADNPMDSQNCNYIWWSKKYHFTTDKEGTIISELSPENNENPIQKLSFANVSQDQDGEFWAQGGDDLVDGSVLINLIMTDILSIAYIQGFGQMVIIGGEDIPDQIDGGPTTAIILRRKDKEDPEPKVSYESADPPLEMHMKALEQYVALLLSTNGLSPTNVANAIDASQFPSGISLMIENSEVSGKIEDKQEIMGEVESHVFELIKLWQNYLFDSNALTDEFKNVGKLSDDLTINVKFNSVKPIISEKEKLETLQMRKDLGISQMVDLIMIDNPDLTREEAEEKLQKIIQEKLSNQKLMMSQIQVKNPNESQNQTEDMNMSQSEDMSMNQQKKEPMDMAQES